MIDIDRPLEQQAPLAYRLACIHWAILWRTDPGETIFLGENFKHMYQGATATRE